MHSEGRDFHLPRAHWLDTGLAELWHVTPSISLPSVKVCASLLRLWSLFILFDVRRNTSLAPRATLAIWPTARSRLVWDMFQISVGLLRSSRQGLPIFNLISWEVECDVCRACSVQAMGRRMLANSLRKAANSLSKCHEMCWNLLTKEFLPCRKPPFVQMPQCAARFILIRALNYIIVLYSVCSSASRFESNLPKVMEVWFYL